MKGGCPSSTTKRKGGARHITDAITTLFHVVNHKIIAQCYCTGAEQCQVPDTGFSSQVRRMSSPSSPPNTRDSTECLTKLVRNVGILPQHLTASQPEDRDLRSTLFESRLTNKLSWPNFPWWQ